MDQVVNKIRTLIEYLNNRTQEYDAGHPTISDEEWDNKYFELEKLEKESSIYFNDSPTQNISYTVVTALEKVEHNHDMLSLEKTKSLTEIQDFLGSVPYLAMCKMDGLTCSLKYSNGELVSAETRGNGKVGENILHNAKVLNSIPKHIPYEGDLIVDGEIICSKKDFSYFEAEYKNPRNFASGSIRLLDSKECAKRKLQFVAWDIIQGFEEKKLLSEKLQELKNIGFIIVPYVKSSSSVNSMLTEISELIPSFAEEKSYLIDGIVFKFDDIEYGKSLGKTSHHFRNALAYKFYDEKYPTTLLDIEWTMGRTGILTPVAIFEPIDIDGSIIERASLHNISVMEEILGDTPHIGQKVSVAKMNMIIPQIVEADKIKCDENSILIPKVCPICGELTKVEESDSGTRNLVCSNSFCAGKFINQLDHFCGKKGLDIKGLSLATLDKLIDWDWVSSYSDLFELKNHRAEWIKKPGFGEKSVDKILNAIESSRQCELSAFIAALGIPLIGSTASKELTKVFKTWDSFMEAINSGYHFYEIQNFGPEMHFAITHFDYTEADNLFKTYLIANSSTEVENNQNDLAGLNFVITGKVVHFKNRDELKAKIEAHGGKVIGSISSKTNYLINNDVNSTSSKNVSAKKLGVPIISEDAFIETFGIS